MNSDQPYHCSEPSGFFPTYLPCTNEYFSLHAYILYLFIIACILCASGILHVSTVLHTFRYYFEINNTLYIIIVPFFIFICIDYNVALPGHCNFRAIHEGLHDCSRGTLQKFVAYTVLSADFI